MTNRQNNSVSSSKATRWAGSMDSRGHCYEVAALRVLGRLVLGRAVAASRSMDWSGSKAMFGFSRVRRRYLAIATRTARRAIASWRPSRTRDVVAGTEWWEMPVSSGATKLRGVSEGGAVRDGREGEREEVNISLGLAMRKGGKRHVGGMDGLLGHVRKIKRED